MDRRILTGVVFILCFLPCACFAETESINCFENYKYGTAGYFDDMHTDKVAYSPGDEVIVSYELVSNMSAPIVEGMTRMQIFYIDSDGDEHLFDEFIDMSDISMQMGDRIEREFWWTVPEGAPTGEYAAKAYLISGDMFNLLGLSFLAYGPPGVPGEMTKFEVVNKESESFVLLDRDETYLNGAKYEFGSYSPAIEYGDEVVISTKLMNTGSAKRVDVTCEVYAWDDVTGAPIRGYSDKKTITAKDGAEDVSFEFPALETGAYEIRITAAAPSQKSIIKMRTSVGGAKGRFIFAGLKSFPLKDGEDNAVFFCMSNSADYLTYFDAHGTIEITDDSGTAIYEDSWGPLEIVPSPMGMISEFVADTDSSYLTLTVNMYDDSGNIMDESSVVYDISKFMNIRTTLEVGTDKDTYSVGDEMRYDVKYEDETGNELRGDIIVYILDPDEVPIYLNDRESIDGEFSDAIKMNGKTGMYTIVVREITHDLVSRKSITLKEISGSNTQAIGTDANINNIIILGIVVVMMLLGVYLYKKKKGGDMNEN